MQGLSLLEAFEQIAVAPLLVAALVKGGVSVLFYASLHEAHHNAMLALEPAVLPAEMAVSVRASIISAWAWRISFLLEIKL